MAANIKKLVKSGLQEKLGLIINMPKSRSNDGKTARKFFRNSSAEVDFLEIDENFVKVFYNILCGLSCNMEVDPLKLKEYCQVTAKLHVERYLDITSGKNSYGRCLG